MTGLRIVRRARQMQLPAVTDWRATWQRMQEVLFRFWLLGA